MSKRRLGGIAVTGSLALATPLAAQGVPGDGLLRGLDLRDEQRDRTFAIRHASDPAAREQVKILRSARGEPSRLALSTDSDETKESALVDRDA